VSPLSPASVLIRCGTRVVLKELSPAHLVNRHSIDSMTSTSSPAVNNLGGKPRGIRLDIL
jgi:hypothetical protein